MYSLEMINSIGRDLPTSILRPKISPLTGSSGNRESRNQESREAIIERALGTTEGRMALSLAMVEPIKRSLEYQGLARKLFMVDELPQIAIPRYEKENGFPAYYWSSKYENPEYRKRKNLPLNCFFKVTSGEDILIPTHELSSCQHVDLDDIRDGRRFALVDRAQEKAKRSLQWQEDNKRYATALHNRKGSASAGSKGPLLTEEEREELRALGYVQ